MEEDYYEPSGLSPCYREMERLAIEYLQSIGMANSVAIIEYVSDVNGRAKQLRPKDAPYTNLPMGKLVLPDPPTGDHHILINSTIKKYQVLETIVHEFVHLFDYISFANIHYNGDYTSMECHPLFRPFYLYSEFNAKSHGLQAKMKYDFTDNVLFFENKLVPYFKKEMHNRPSDCDIVRVLAELHARIHDSTEDMILNTINTIFEKYDLDVIYELYTSLSNLFNHYNYEKLSILDSMLSKLYQIKLQDETRK